MSTDTDNKTMFEAAFVISLSFRTDRLQSFRKQTQSLTSLPEIKVWPAVCGDICEHPPIWTAGNGAWGCYRSHLAILEHCLNENISSYIVFEDDAQFRPDFDKYITEFYKELPEDWQQIYLGGQLQYEETHPPIRISKNVLRPFNVNRTHCFAVSRRGMLPIYKHITNLPFWEDNHIDHHLGRWHEDPTNQVFCPNQWLVGQMGFSSNVSGRVEDVTFYSDPESYTLSHWLFDKPVCAYYTGDPLLLRIAKPFLHQGNKLEHHGFDITIAQAARYANPRPEINRWYNWIRSEIIRGRSTAIPCFYHPTISPSMVEEATNAKVYPIHPHSLSEIERAVQEIINEQM